MTTTLRFPQPHLLAPLLLPLLLLLLLALGLSAAPAARAHYSGAYSHDGDVKSMNPDWMAQLPDEAPLAGLSIPGTHDSHALFGGDAVQCQELQFKEQLLSGIRAFDIRCRHINNACAIHHGAFYQNANLNDALSAFADFLWGHPGEALLMRLKTDETTPTGNTRSWYDTVTDYVTQYDKWIWRPASQLASPLLGDVRGKIVILQDFSVTDSRTGSPYWFGLDYNTVLDIQDNYWMSTNWDLYGKWEAVRNHLAKAANSYVASQFFMNYLSGAGGSFPYFVASGHVSQGTSANRLSTGLTTCPWLCDSDKYPDFPRTDCVGSWCTISFEGTNVLAAAWSGFTPSGYLAGTKPRVGILMADFPGPDLIGRIIASNCIRADGFTASVGYDHVGDDLANMGTNDVADLAGYCAGNPRCRAFNVQGWVKAAAGPIRSSPGFCFYTKTKQDAAVADGSVVSIATSTSNTGCMDVKMNQQTPGTNLWQWNCNNSPAQKFTLKAAADAPGYYTIVTSGTHCLTVGGTGAGSDITLMGCRDGYASQQFAIKVGSAAAVAAAVASVVETAESVNGTSAAPVINATSSSSVNATSVNATSVNVTSSVNATSVNITAVNATSVNTTLSVNATSVSGAAVNGTSVDATAAAESPVNALSSSPAEPVNAVLASLSPSYTLEPRSLPGMCVDIRSGSADKGAAVQVWNCNRTKAQLFLIG